MNERDDYEKKIIKIIQADVLRTQPECKLFRNKKIQDILARLLFIWNMRHPASGFFIFISFRKKYYCEKVRASQRRRWEPQEGLF